MSRCDLFLENYENEYTAGEQIIGYLQCTFVNEKVITGISVTFHGEVNTYWNQRRGNRNKHYRANEIIFHVEIQLIHFLGEGNVTIPSGTHRYPFVYTLPQNIPSTFKAGSGEAKFTVKGLVRRLCFKRDYEAKAEINIICPMDLNLKPNLRQQCTLKEVNDVWSIVHYVCCEKWPLTSEFRLPYSGFVPGQNVPIDFVIRNFTNTTVRKVKFSIIYKQNFISTFPKQAERIHTYTIAKLKLPGIGAFNEKYYDEVLKVPRNFNPPNFDCSQIINTSYLLQAEICLPFFVSNIKLSHSITIGNIPLQNLASSPNDEPPAYNNLEGLLSVIPSRELPGMPLFSDPFPLARRVYWDQSPNYRQPSINSENQLPNYEEAMLMMTRN